MIKLYYHIYTSSHRILGLSFVDQQLRRIYPTQLQNFAELNCVIHGPHHEEVREIITRYGGWRILECRPDDPEGLRETRTLRYIWQDAGYNDIVAFIHTKGIAYHSGEKAIHGFTLPRNLRAINSWRFALEYFCIDDWRNRFDRLSSGIDTESAFMNLEPYWNYAGNMWWSRGDHIRKLPDPTGIEGIDLRDAARSWLFWHKGNHISLFHVLDKPREDGRGGYGTFRLHEDDLMKYLIEDRNQIGQSRLLQMRPEAMQILEQFFIEKQKTK